MSDKQSFIKENIVKKNRRGKTVKRILTTIGTGILFGAIAVITAALLKPVTDKYIAKETEPSLEQVIIERDEPLVEEIITAPKETIVSESEPKEETKPVEEIVQKELEGYRYSIDDMNYLWSSVRDVGTNIEKTIVEVVSKKNGVDIFDAEVEESESFSGVVIAKTSAEWLILTLADAVNEAEEIIVATKDHEANGNVKGIDKVNGLAIVSVSKNDFSSSALSDTKVAELGNSYLMQKGSMVIAAGNPLGVYSSSVYCFISYLEKSESAIDGRQQVMYLDRRLDAKKGCWLFNTSGQLVGWAIDSTDTEGNTADYGKSMTISLYKNTLEKLINGTRIPYFGIEVEELINPSEEMPSGLYVKSVKSVSPAYYAGVQAGDILKAVGKNELKKVSEYLATLENLIPGEQTTVTVSRAGRDEYRDIVFEINIGTREE